MTRPRAPATCCGSLSSVIEDDLIHEIAQRARAGEPLFCTELAMLIHRLPERTRPFGVNDQYERWLANALHNADSELLVCIGEELGKGVLLARNGRLSAQFFDRADKGSPFMGAYMMGRIVAKRGNRVLTDRFLGKAIEAGHVVSKVLKLRCAWGRIQWVPFVRPVFVLREISAFLKAFGRNKDNPGNLRTAFWRYKDLLPKGIIDVDELLGDDRARPFSELEKMLAAAS